MICISPRKRNSYFPDHFPVTSFLLQRKTKTCRKHNWKQSEQRGGLSTVWHMHGPNCTNGYKWCHKENGQTRPQQLLSALLSPSYAPWWLHTSFLTRFSMQKGYIQPVLHHLYAVFLFVSHLATHWVKNVKDHSHFIDLPQGLTPRSPRDFRQNAYLLTSNHRSVKSVHLCDSTKKRLS